jgi:hypothetical protein
VGLFDEPLEDIRKNCLAEWDYSDIFPMDIDYGFKRGPVLVTGWPWQLLRELQPKVNQQATQPIISIVSLEPMESTRSFSDIDKTGAGVGQLQYRLGRRAAPSFLISCWADQQLGGMDFARKLGGKVYEAIFYYRNRLSTIRHLRMIHSHESIDDTAQLFRFDVVVEGDVYITLDV